MDNAEFFVQLERAMEEKANRESLQWLKEKKESLESSKSDSDFFLYYSAVSRYFPKNFLEQPDKIELKSIPGSFTLNNWTQAESARVLLLQWISNYESGRYNSIIEKLFSAFDVGELCAYMKGIYFIPHVKIHYPNAREGMRSNMIPVFLALAHKNPFPFKYFEEESWNQMILKTLFIESSLHPILGLDERANPRLASMLTSFARERKAAGRAVSPELWRCVGPFAQSEVLDLLEEYLRSRDEQEALAAGMALNSSPDPRASEILSKNRDLLEKIKKNI